MTRVLRDSVWSPRGSPPSLGAPATTRCCISVIWSEIWRHELRTYSYTLYLRMLWGKNVYSEDQLNSWCCNLSLKTKCYSIILKYLVDGRSNANCVQTYKQKQHFFGILFICKMNQIGIIYNRAYPYGYCSPGKGIHYFSQSRGSITILIWILRILFLLLHEKYCWNFEIVRDSLLGNIKSDIDRHMPCITRQTVYKIKVNLFQRYMNCIWHFLIIDLWILHLKISIINVHIGLDFKQCFVRHIMCH